MCNKSQITGLEKRSVQIFTDLQFITLKVETNSCWTEFVFLQISALTFVAYEFKILFLQCG